MRRRTGWNRSARGAAIAGLLAAAARWGCGESPRGADDARTAEPEVLRSEIEEGPIRVLVTAEPTTTRLSDQITLRVFVSRPAGVSIAPPDLGRAWGDFIVVARRELPPEQIGRREVFEQVYTLEPKRAGTLAIAAVEVAFADQRPDGDGARQLARTKPLSVQITTLVEGEASLADLKGPEGPVGIPLPGSNAWWWAVGAAAALAALTLVVWRRRRRPVHRVLSPRDLAEEDLDRLAAARWAERDVKRFYLELTGLVRRYIERSTGVRAPEQTTEEFLQEIGRRATFSYEDRLRLKDFLEAADLVKFAAQRPGREDLEESLVARGCLWG